MTYQFWVGLILSEHGDIILSPWSNIYGRKQKLCKSRTDRSSRLEVFCKKGVLRNLAKFTGKHLCQSLFFNKVEACNFIKKRLWHRCFPMNFVKFLKRPFFIEHLWLLLLNRAANKSNFISCEGYTEGFRRF